MERCPYCGRRMCGTFTGSDSCEPDLYRKAFQFSQEEIEVLREDWGTGYAEMAEEHNECLRQKKKGGE